MVPWHYRNIDWKFPEKRRRREGSANALALLCIKSVIIPWGLLRGDASELARNKVDAAPQINTQLLLPVAFQQRDLITSSCVAELWDFFSKTLGTVSLYRSSYPVIHAPCRHFMYPYPPVLHRRPKREQAMEKAHSNLGPQTPRLPLRARRLLRRHHLHPQVLHHHPSWEARY